MQRVYSNEELILEHCSVQSCLILYLLYFRMSVIFVNIEKKLTK